MKYRAIRYLAVSAVISIIILAPFQSTRDRDAHSKLKHLADALDKKSQRYDEPAEAQEFFNLKRSPDGHSPVRREWYVKAIEHAEEMPQYSTALASFHPSERSLSAADREQLDLGAWTPLGPGNIGGRTRALLIDPTNPAIMYAAGVAGGVWKTVNEGATWTPLGDMLPNLAVCSLTFDPADTNIIYAGTGEGYFNSDMVRGAGIYKTTDAGATWNRFASTTTTDFNYVNDIVVSRNDRQRLYAATRTGVWTSADGGENWTRSLNPLDGGGLTVLGGCLDLIMRTDQATDYLFASCGSFAQATVYRNTDAAGAGAWTPVLSETGMGRTTLAIAPSNQSVIYALAASNFAGTYNLGLLAVFRSTSSGDAGSWTAQVRNTNPTKLNTVLLSNPLIAFLSECGQGGNAFFNQGWYDNAIAVDPVNPDRVWAGGIDLFRSDDAGQNWGIASYWWADRTDSHFAHADQHLIVFHPQYDGDSNRIMYVSNDGGIFRTNNARANLATGTRAPCDPANTGVRWTSLNNNYGVTQFYHGLPYPNGLTYMGGTQDNGTLRGMDATGTSGWATVFGGDGGYVAIDPTDTDTIYVETTRLSIRKSINGGASFFTATSGITESSGNFQFINTFMMDPSIPERLWTGGRSLWRTSDGASTWTQASAPLSIDRSVSAIAIAPTNSNRVIVGLSGSSIGGGFIHRNDAALTSNSATAWPGVQPRAGFVSWVTFDPMNENVAYATYTTFGGPHVYKSTDAGATWASIDGAGATGIPDVPVHCIVVDHADSQRLYVGTDIGVFVSLDGGANWARENTGFANATTESLAIGSVGSNNVLFAFTHGRGAWKVTLGPATPKILSASVAGKKLFVFGQGFDSGAKVLLGGEEQKTKNDSDSINTNLISKKAGKKIDVGERVDLQVRLAGGGTTPVFSFTRP
ncbi:MAG: hypothetical protein AB1631_04105 [Acidobacteriota bacterium]